MKQPLDNVLIQKANAMNRNGRIYTPDVLRTMLADIKRKGPIFGTLGQTEDLTNIDVSKISHQVRNMRVTEDGLYADIVLQPTPMGQMLRQLHVDEIPFKFALRVMMAPPGPDGVVKRCIFVSVDAVKETA